MRCILEAKGRELDNKTAVKEANRIRKTRVPSKGHIRKRKRMPHGSPNNGKADTGKAQEINSSTGPDEETRHKEKTPPGKGTDNSLVCTGDRQWDGS